MSSLLADLRSAWRKVRNAPGGALVAIVSIGFGVGVSAAIFGAVDRVLLSPLAYPSPERVIAVTERDGSGAVLGTAYGNFVELAQRSRSFEALAAVDRWAPSLVSGGEPERLAGELVSPDYFRVLGIAPSLGRGFEAADDVRGAPRVAVLAAALAQRRFGGAAAALSRTVVLDGEPHRIVGVMPAGFENALSPAVEIWAPLRFRAAAPFDSAEWGHHQRMLGRLRAGVTLAVAQAEIDAIASAATEEFPRAPSASLARGLVLEPLQEALTRDVRAAMLALLGAVLLLLAIACANVTNILLARAMARRHELAVRAALGADHGRLVQQLLAESALIAALGGIVGVGVAALGSRALAALAPATLPRLETIGLDARVLAFALAATAVVAVATGLLPALRARELGARSGLATGARSTPRGLLVWRHSLVVAQVALATVLLASAGLVLRSVWLLFDVPVGFDAERALTMQVVADGGGRRTDQERLALLERTLEAVRSVPGVQSAAYSSQLPLSGDNDVYGVRFEAEAAPNAAPTSGAFRYAVTPSWFEAMRIPLKRGRLLGADDTVGAPAAVLINESFAARRFPDADPIGERLRIGPNIGRPDAEWATVVGVVGDVKQTSLAATAPDAVYVSIEQWNWVDSVQSLVVRSVGDGAGLVEPVKRAVWSVDANVPLVRVTTLREMVAASEAQRTFALTVFAAFGLAALLLAGVGVYGVVEGRVAERTREIGVRSALGATPTSVVGLVVRQGLGLTVAGAVIGLLAAVGAAQAIASLLFATQPIDPLTYAGTVGLLTLVALVSCAAPALRAARIDPAITLRAD